MDGCIKTVIARSASLWGPYEGCPENPIFTNVHDTGKQILCAGHGDLFCDHRGNWWMVHLAIRLSRRAMRHLGRETFLTPLYWQDGWPRAENRKSLRQVSGLRSVRKMLYGDRNRIINVVVGRNKGSHAGENQGNALPAAGWLTAAILGGY